MGLGPGRTHPALGWLKMEEWILEMFQIVSLAEIFF